MHYRWHSCLADSSFGRLGRPALCMSVDLSMFHSCLFVCLLIASPIFLVHMLGKLALQFNCSILRLTIPHAICYWKDRVGLMSSSHILSLPRILSFIMKFMMSQIACENILNLIYLFHCTRDSTQFWNAYSCYFHALIHFMCCMSFANAWPLAPAWRTDAGVHFMSFTALA